MPVVEDSQEQLSAVEYPPKFPLSPNQGQGPLIKGLYSLVLFLGLGYMLLRRWDLLLLLSAVLLLHEAGHFLAMKYFRYQELNILFLPFLGALVRGSKHQISQSQSAIILLAGPLPGIFLGLLLQWLTKGESHYWGEIPVELVIQLLIWGNLLNLLPVYPLDGGQLLNRVYLDEEGRMSSLFMTLSALFITGLAFKTGIYLLLIFPALFIYRLIASRSNQRLEKEMEEAGLPLDHSYASLPDADYWKIRTQLIRHIPSLQAIDPGPPYQFSTREEKVAQTVASVLQRTLLMDMSIGGKIGLALVWIGALAAPWLLKIPFDLLGALRI